MGRTQDAGDEGPRDLSVRVVRVVVRTWTCYDVSFCCFTCHLILISVVASTVTCLSGPVSLDVGCTLSTLSFLQVQARQVPQVP